MKRDTFLLGSSEVICRYCGHGRFKIVGELQKTLMSESTVSSVHQYAIRCAKCGKIIYELKEGQLEAS